MNRRKSIAPFASPEAVGQWRLGNLRPSDGNVRVALEYSPPPSSTAIWVVLFAVTMMFAAFSSA